MTHHEARPATLPVVSHAELNDPEVLRRLRGTSPVHHVSVGGWYDSWILTGYDHTMAVLGDNRLMNDADGAEQPGPTPIGELLSEEDLITLPGPQHARLRRLVVRQLTARRAEALRPRIQQQIDRLMAAMEPEGITDFVAAFALPLPAVVLCDLFDIPEAGRNIVFEYIPGLTTDVRSRPTPAAAGEYRRAAMSAMVEVLRVLVRHRREHPGDDLISAMIRTPGEQPTEAEVIAAVRLVLVAGHRAVTALIANGLHTLLHRRALWEQLVDDPGLLDTAVEELLRWVTPIALSVPRFTRCPIDVGGTVVPEGQQIQAAWGAANRDPARVCDPDAVQLNRVDNPHLSFGHGMHFCAGAALGRIEATMVLRTLIDRFPGITLAGDEPPAYRMGSVRELRALPVILRPT